MMMEMDVPPPKTESLGRLTDDVLDVLIVGGGIVGAGIARSAAMRGLRTGLVEQNDFASGTSGRSSRLLHGGIRYLAQGNIRLVRQSSREKRVMQRIAAHLAEPLPFVFPTYQKTKWPHWKLRIGVKCYDLLCNGRNLGTSSAMHPAAAEAAVPGIRSAGLTGAVRYFDGATNDARLVLDTLRSAVHYGAAIASYTALTDSRRNGSRWACRIADREAGAEHAVDTRCVINATGPWSEALPHSSISLRKTKGVHIVIDRRRLNVSEAVMMTEGPRVVYAIPWGERVYVGTTDTNYHGDPAQVATEVDDIDYIQQVTNAFFPAAALTRDDVISTWAGVRPLVADKGSPSDVSRSHLIRMGQPGWCDVAGGKLTTHRLMAEEVVDMLLNYLGKDKVKPTSSEIPLLTAAETAKGFSSIVPPAVSRAAVEFYCRHEWAVHLDDVMIRRTHWHYYHPNNMEIAERVAGWMAGCLAWDKAQIEAERRRYLAHKD